MTQDGMVLYNNERLKHIKRNAIALLIALIAELIIMAIARCSENNVLLNVVFWISVILLGQMTVNIVLILYCVVRSFANFLHYGVAVSGDVLQHKYVAGDNSRLESEELYDICYVRFMLQRVLLAVKLHEFEG